MQLHVNFTCVQKTQSDILDAPFSKNSQRLKADNYFRKKLYLRYLTRF